MEYISKLWHSMLEFWNEKTRLQKLIIVSLFASALIVIFAIFLFTSRPNHVPLYTNLELDEAGEITKKLDDMKIGYELTDEGKTILVNPEDKYRTRIQLAQEGLPKGGLDFNDVMDSTRLGTTEWEKQLQYNQALQGELKRTIESLEEVETASVHIVQEEKTNFLNLDKAFKPTAAVVLKLFPGAQIKDDQVLGIINLISHSVRGLEEDNITIIDSYGRVLSNLAHQADDTNEIISKQLAIQSNLQKELQSNVQSLLEQIYGIGNVVVRVNTQLNFDKRIVESRSFTPSNEETGEGVLLSTQESREYSSGSTGGPQGPPGVDANVPPTYQQPLEGDSEYSRSEITKNYEINETLENLNIAPGVVERVSVSAVVNKDIDDAERLSIANMIAHAVGSDPEEDISVEGIEFSNDFVKALQDVSEAQDRQRLIRVYALSGAGLILLIAITYLVRHMLRRRSRPEDLDLAEQVMLAQEEAAASKSIEDEIEEDQVFTEIQKYARRKPEDIAKLLRTWLEEE